jgi:hypothetical protein
MPTKILIHQDPLTLVVNVGYGEVAFDEIYHGDGAVLPRDVVEHGARGGLDDSWISADETVPVEVREDPGVEHAVRV